MPMLLRRLSCVTVRDIRAVNQDAPRRCRRRQQQVNDGGLAGAERANQSDLFAGRMTSDRFSKIGFAVYGSGSLCCCLGPDFASIPGS